MTALKLERENMKTFMLRKEDVEHKWFIIDAENQVLGKVAERAAFVLRGKHKPTFTPHVDCGDNVIIINAEKVILTGDKLNKKIYYNHSGYPGGLRERTARVMKEQYPVEMVERAVWGMLPKNRLGRQMYRHLFVYEGSAHKHEAQKPERLEVK
jgi:large subunit ribosomal protein L13